MCHLKYDEWVESDLSHHQIDNLSSAESSVQVLGKMRPTLLTPFAINFHYIHIYFLIDSSSGYIYNINMKIVNYIKKINE